MSGFDRFMVALDAAANLKVKRLKRVAGKEARWAWFHGVLPIAAKAEMRGSFCIGTVAADEHDVADVADVTIAEARRMLAAAREMEMLERDDAGVEWVHDFEVYNPEPKRDRTSAKRSRDYRERQRRRRDVTAPSRRDVTAVTAPEVEEEVEGTAEEDAGVRTQTLPSVLHPRLPEVLAVLGPLGLVVEEMAVNAACRAHGDIDPVVAAHRVAEWAHRGELRTTAASSLLWTAMDKLQQQAARVHAASSQSAPRLGGGHLSAEARAAALEAEAAAELDAA